LDRDLAQALACFETACELTPEDGGGWAGRAGVLRSLGRHEEAIRAYDRLLALVPGESAFWFERADCLENVNRLDEALKSYERGLQIEPGLASAWADRGHVLQRLGRRQEALSSNIRATDCDPQLFTAWLNRAELERALGLSAAGASYQRFLDTVPPGQHEQMVQLARKQLAALAASVPEWQRLLESAQAAEAAGNIDESLALCRRVIELHPPIASRILHNMGIMLTGAGRIVPAHQCYLEALKLAPDQLATWGELGRLFMRAGRIEQAVGAFRRLLALAPEDLSSRLSLARLLRQQGKFQAALDELKLVREPDPEVNYLQGSCLLGLGQFAEALLLLEQVAPDHPDGMIDRGICLERLNRKPEALACFELGHPLSGRRWFHLARYRREHAAEYLARAVQLQLAVDRHERLDPMAAAELAHARKRLAELDPERAATLDAEDRAQRHGASLATP
jgi:tetratricopeptide (TPR) repeat protein